MSILRKLKTAFRFSRPEWKAILRAYFFLVKTRFLISWCSLPSVEEALSSTQPSPRQPPRRFSEKELVILFRLAWRYQLPRPKCLATALARRLFLAHYGHSVTFQIGVRKDANEFQAHAWCGSKEDHFSALELSSR